MSEQIMSCPFCGSGKVDFDRLNGRNGKIHAVRMQCQNCGAGTAWNDDSHQAVTAWNMRDAQSALQTSWDKRFDNPEDRIVNNDLFILGEETCARNPQTGNCYVYPRRGDGKARRISRKVFMEMYQSCEKKVAEKNKAHGGK